MDDPNELAARKPDAAIGEPADSPKTISAQDLFAGKREVHIELDGVTYLLRITRRNKLILQK